MAKVTVLRSLGGVYLEKVEPDGVPDAVTYSVSSVRVPVQIYEGDDREAAEKAFADEVHRVRNA